MLIKSHLFHLMLSHIIYFWDKYEKNKKFSTHGNLRHQTKPIYT